MSTLAPTRPTRDPSDAPTSASVRVHESGAVRLECGVELASVQQAYTLIGELNRARDNLIVLFHSLTSGPDPLEWWPDQVGPDRPIEGEWAVLTPNLLGSCLGTTPVPAGVEVTPRDMARLVRRLVADLGVRSVALAAGGSLGGMVALEWAASFPTLTRSVVAFAAPALHRAGAIGFGHAQLQALRLGGAAGDPEAGLALARIIAMLTYRSGFELHDRFGRDRREDGTPQVSSWLNHHGRRLADRFDPDSYGTLVGAMDAHDVGRGRGGVQAALQGFEGDLVGVGITGDPLYPPDEVQDWVELTGSRYREIRSVHGHDGFLLEPMQVGAILRDALEPTGHGPAHEGEGS